MSASIAEPVARQSGVALAGRLAGPAVVAAILLMLIVPLSPLVISLMFAMNISAGLVILASAIYIPQTSEFLAFPSILLGTTLMRLALNVATARAILLHGYTGSDAAGMVIQSFGRFVVGGNYVVGIIIFGILITINFVVVTKGSSRVAEVSARFMLDSLPGRQMAIDADVNAGSISAKEAERRRDMLRREADFFGAMDGASKFVRGDVVAAMIILGVNLVGGLLIGTLQHGLPIGVAAHTYTLLTVGDGVAAQIPSLAISVAAGLIVTRVATGEDISAQVIGQISRYPQALLVAAGLTLALGMMPGMAHVPFLAFGGAIGFMGLRLRSKHRAEELVADSMPAKSPPDKGQKLDTLSVQKVDAFGLEIGFGLVQLVGEQSDGKPSLVSRLTAVRTRYSRRMGFLLPNIHIRDAEGVRPQEYRFTIRGAPIARGEVVANAVLAIETADVVDKLAKGRKAKEPVFGHEALWIDPEQVGEAETRGYTVVEPSGVIATHLDRLLQTHGAELLGRAEVEDLLSALAKTHPKLADDIRNRFTPGFIRQILAGLVSENVSIKDLERIAEALLETPEASGKDAEAAVASVRVRIGRQIIAPYLAESQNLAVLAIAPDLEAMVTKAIDTAREQGMRAAIEPRTLALLRSAAREGKKISAAGHGTPVLAVPGRYRYPIATCLNSILPVIAMEEIPFDQPITLIGTIEPVQVPNAGAA